MRKTLLSILSASIAALSQAQTASTFESQPLVGQDTFYVNDSAPGANVGFQDGLAYFPCVYDTGFGVSFWSYGFAYSNMRDSITSGFTNQYSAKTAMGYNASANYAIAYGAQNTVSLLPPAMGKDVRGFYVTNTTYAYNSMRDGDAFSKKFGGATGNDPDYFLLKVRGYSNGQLESDSVVTYLADYRTAGTANDFILNQWQWVDLLPLGSVDSLLFSLESSDNGGFGMNTPAYFALDNFTTNEGLSVGGTAAPSLVRAFPNPATDRLVVQAVNGNFIPSIEVLDALGRTMLKLQDGKASHEINIAAWPAGSYILRAAAKEGVQSVRFVKQ